MQDTPFNRFVLYVAAAVLLAVVIYVAGKCAGILPISHKEGASDMLLHNWKEIVDAIEPGHAQRLAGAQQAEGWLICAMELERCPWVVRAGIYKDDECEEMLAFPFTLTKLCEFLDAGPSVRMKALAVDGPHCSIQV